MNFSLTYPTTFLFLLLMMCSSAMAQRQDFGVWAGARVNKKWNKQWRSFGEFQLRFNQNATSLRSGFIQAATTYRPTKWFKVRATYRLTQYTERVINAHRVDIDTFFRYKMKKQTIEARLKYQKSFIVSDIKPDRFRVRFKYQYRFNKKLKLYVKAQYFYTVFYRYKLWNQQRYSIGTVVLVAKNNYLDIFYIVDIETDVANPYSQFTAGLKYKFYL